MAECIRRTAVDEIASLGVNSIIDSLSDGVYVCDVGPKDHLLEQVCRANYGLARRGGRR